VEHFSFTQNNGHRSLVEISLGKLANNNVLGDKNRKMDLVA
jgi:hypothetical protein